MPSIRLPSRLTTAWPSPNGTSITLAPPVRNKADAAKWVWLAGAGIAIPNLAGVALRILDELLQRLPWRVGAHREHRRLHAHPRDRVEGPIVELQDARVIVGRDRIRIPDDRMTIGLLLTDVIVTDRAAAAGAIDDRDRHVQRPRHPVRQIACRPVGGAPRPEPP